MAGVSFFARLGNLWKGFLSLWISDIEKEHPFLKETLISAMGNVELSRLLDPRYLHMDEAATETEPEPAGDRLIPLTV